MRKADKKWKALCPNCGHERRMFVWNTFTTTGTRLKVMCQACKHVLHDDILPVKYYVFEGDDKISPGFKDRQQAVDHLRTLPGLDLRVHGQTDYSFVEDNLKEIE